MNILEQIIRHKRAEVTRAQSERPLAQLERNPHFKRNSLSLKTQLRAQSSSGIIAEIKRRSPSKGVINTDISVPQVAAGYFSAGASAISVLTDSHYFGGTLDDLRAAREAVACPLLRKDFIIDTYQIVEAKASGADLILLIAAALTPKEVSSFTSFAHNVGLEVLLEIHDSAELSSHVTDEVDVVGVNNRSLKTFSVDIATSLELADKIPAQLLKISESGLEQVETIKQLQGSGYRGFLIGENFMKTADPSAACRAFIENLRAAA